MTNKYRIQIILNIIMLLLFGALFITGTFADETISGTLFTPGNTVVGIITSTGVYPFFAAFILFGGALFERALHSGVSKPLKIILCIFCAAFALGAGFFGGKTLTDRSGFGSVFPSVIGSIPVIAVICVVFEYPLFFLGFHFAKKSDDKLLVHRIAGLLFVLLLAYGATMLLKSAFPRPRYRTVVLGYEGVGFVPWYSPVANAGSLAEMHELSIDEFRSFPSGHSILSVSSLYIFPTFSWLSAKLKDKQLMLSICGLAFGCMIMLTRIVVGAHYLSDVSMGAMIAILLSFIFTFIQIRISGKKSKT